VNYMKSVNSSKIEKLKSNLHIFDDVAEGNLSHVHRLITRQ